MAKNSYVYALGAAWVKVADAGDTVFLEPQEGGQILLQMKATAPTAGSLVGHVLNPYQFRSYVALIENMWARSIDTGELLVTNDDAGSGSGSSGTTANVSLSTGWTQIAATTDSFVEIEHLDGAPVLWLARATAPTAGLRDGHLLRPTDRYVDAVNDANIWARSLSVSTAVTASIIISKG